MSRSLFLFDKKIIPRKESLNGQPSFILKEDCYVSEALSYNMKGGNGDNILHKFMKINRLFEIIYLLLDRKCMTAGDLATYFEVSVRTIYRDVDLLSSAGIPIYMSKGKGGGISLLPDFILNKTVLTDSEKTDILSALHAVDAVSLENTTTAVNKLSSLFGMTNRDWVEVDFSEWANDSREYELFTKLKSAVLSKNTIQILYHSKNENTRRVVEPLKLCFKGQSWYLYAYCRLRIDYRFFKLRRIQDMTVLDELFQRLAPPKIFEDTKIFQDDFVSIKLKVSKEMAYRVYDEFPQYELLPDGSFIVTITIPKGDWIFHYLALFGEYCEVLEPKEIRIQVKEKLQKTLKKYL